MRNRVLVVIAAGVLTIVGAACGSGGSDDPSAGAERPSTAQETATWAGSIGKTTPDGRFVDPARAEESCQSLLAGSGRPSQLEFPDPATGAVITGSSQDLCVNFLESRSDNLCAVVPWPC